MLVSEKKYYLPYNFLKNLKENIKQDVWCNLVKIMNIYVYMYAYFFHYFQKGF